MVVKFVLVRDILTEAAKAVDSILRHLRIYHARRHNDPNEGELHHSVQKQQSPKRNGTPHAYDIRVNEDGRVPDRLLDLIVSHAELFLALDS
eukprot:6410308-Prymnesium_polylepis.1